MSNAPDLWEVREVPSGLALELRASDNPALVLAQGENRVRVELVRVKGLMAALTNTAAHPKCEPAAVSTPESVIAVLIGTALARLIGYLDWAERRYLSPTKLRDPV